MKTPRFWYPRRGVSKTSLSSDLLVPFSGVFKAGTCIRRAFAKPHHARVPIICIGNVVAGGAGKTPTALALARILKDHGQKPIFVTRGYGGRGDLVYVDPSHHTAEDVGDEALLLAKSSPTWAGRDRIQAVRQAETHGTLIIMDDGLQNPSVVSTVSLLVVDGDMGIGNGRIIPAGPLRESFDEALNRVAALIIVGDRDRQNLAAHAHVPVFRARLEPNLPPGFSASGKFIAFAGIARPEKLYMTARGLGLNIVSTVDFPDHHPFSASDIAALRQKAKDIGAQLLTTEKDEVRLPADFRAEVQVLPIQLVFDDPDAEDELAQLCLSSETPVLRRERVAGMI
jgi:tetraacyldisaccharide 4'-kinase